MIVEATLACLHVRLRSAHPTSPHLRTQDEHISSLQNTGQLFSGEFAFSTTRAGGVIA